MDTPGSTPVRIFIGSGESSILERRTLIHSLQRTTKRVLDIRVFNGTHDTIEVAGQEPVRVGMPLAIKYRNFTEFSLYRFLIPSLCGHVGRALWLDSDMLCLDDIGTLFDMNLHGCDVACVPAYSPDAWATSVMLIDCARARFDLVQVLGEIDRGLYSMEQFMRLEPPYLRQHPLAIAPMDGGWNSFDTRDEHTRLVHFTNLRTQPWRVPGHPLAPLWRAAFGEARQAGLITERDIRRALSLGHAGAAALEGREPDSTPVPRRRGLLGRLRDLAAGRG